MKLLKIIFTVLMVFTISCKKSAEKSEFASVQNDIKTVFDVATATEIIEKRSKEFEEVDTWRIFRDVYKPDND
jgi:hypothetical protein